MDDDTIDEMFGCDEPVIDTVPDNRALELDEDDTVLTSAAPEPDESPWADHSIRGVVYFASGSTRVA